jgi:DNA (cytosine-5)-methyltransferase 1
MIDYSKDFFDFCVSAETVDKTRIEEISNELHIASLLNNCNLIIDKSYAQKGVFTVLVTLIFYKIKHPEQDIRLHKVELFDSKNPIKKGFSGRSFDTKHITPNMKKLGLPSMAESGWLTRSLEQAAPYDTNFPGKISGGVKDAFLNVLMNIEVNSFSPTTVLTYLINKAFIKASENIIQIEKLKNADSISILQLIQILDNQFHYNYGTSGAAKLPMLAFHAIYQILLKELNKFSGCSVPPIGSYTASDRTSRTAGDLEVFNLDGSLQEAIEIKLNIPIDIHMLRIAQEKIYRFNPKRYYILSTAEILPTDLKEIYEEIEEINSKHGCQLILNGVLHTLKYYLRLIDNIKDFIDIYSNLIEIDSELKLIHKQHWAESIKLLNNN